MKIIKAASLKGPSTKELGQSDKKGEVKQTSLGVQETVFQVTKP